MIFGGDKLSNIIYASKFYKNSKYQDFIKSAVNDPINVELMKQINDYVEDDNSEVDTDMVDFGSDTTEELDFSDIDIENDIEKDFEDDSDIDGEDFEEPISDENIFDTEDVKDRLNESTDSSGVVRVVDNDDNNEIWIHYNDKTNLNNVMESVIDFITNEYDGYEFNRLARTENAIVFTYEDTESESEFDEDFDESPIDREEFDLDGEKTEE